MYFANVQKNRTFAKIIMIKKGFAYIFSTLIIAVYLLSSVGFSIHKCSCEGTANISILIGNPDCEHLHAHIDLSHDNHHCQHNHHDGCCTNEVLVLTIDQDNPDSDISVLPAQVSDYTFYLSDNSISVEIEQTESFAALKEAPPLILHSTDLPVISQWRL